MSKVCGRKDENGLKVHSLIALSTFLHRINEAVSYLEHFEKLSGNSNN